MVIQQSSGWFFPPAVKVFNFTKSAGDGFFFDIQLVVVSHIFGIFTPKIRGMIKFD